MHDQTQSLKSRRAAVIIVFFLLQSQFCLSQHVSPDNEKTGTIQTIGDVFLFVLPTATVATGFIIGDETGVWKFTKGLLATQAVTQGLKLTIEKQRPDKSDNRSFPSGHTSTVFHSAGYLHRRYGFVYSLPAYVLAGFTAASRIDAKKHELIDVMAGAVIGLGSNLLFTTEYQQEHMALTFCSGNGGRMLGFTYKF